MTINNYKSSIYFNIKDVIFCNNNILIGLLISLIFSCNNEKSSIKDEAPPIIYTEPNIIKDTDLLFIGSSTIYNWENIEETFSNFKCVNNGISGSTIQDLIEKKEQLVFSYNPKYLIIYYGDNDLYQFDKQEYLKKFQTIFKEISIRRKNTKILILSIKPSPARKEKHEEYNKLNKIISEYCKTNKSFHFIDLWNKLKGNEFYLEDQLHLSKKGYEVLNTAVLSKLNDI